MARLDPLTGTLERPAEIPKPKRKRTAKAATPKPEPALAPTKKNAARVPQSAAHAAPLTPAAQQAARLPLATCTVLFKLPDVNAARCALNAFIVWCNARPELTDWRAAWTIYGAAGQPAPTPTAAPTPAVAAPRKIVPFPAAAPARPARSWGHGVIDRL
ncbi:MAG TPA: hypothetical protein VF614_13505 [Chthoniobacteraceae bacterium]|jgi:hypothetical protein